MDNLFLVGGWGAPKIISAADYLNFVRSRNAGSIVRCLVPLRTGSNVRAKRNAATRNTPSDSILLTSQAGAVDCRARVVRHFGVIRNLWCCIWCCIVGVIRKIWQIFGAAYGAALLAFFSDRYWVLLTLFGASWCCIVRWQFFSDIYWVWLTMWCRNCTIVLLASLKTIECFACKTVATLALGSMVCFLHLIGNPMLTPLPPLLLMPLPLPKPLPSTLVIPL